MYKRQVMDWRMALLSLVTLVVGLAVMSAGMKNYPVKWEGAVKAVSYTHLDVYKRQE